GIVPLEGAAGDPHMAPEYPGITESESLSDWDPPFPVDLSRVRPQDEEYWDQYRTTPKAFIRLARGQELWQSRYGSITSIRVLPEGEDLNGALATYGESLREALDPLELRFTVYPARAQGLRASRGTTDFGEYFIYFSFFLVVSALLLAGLFFRVGVEQRLREIGIFHALGFTAAGIRSLFLREGVLLAVLGSFAGVIGALAYAGLILFGLRTWWVDAVGTRLLTLHVSPASLLVGGLGGVLAAAGAITWTLRGLRPVTPRSLLTGSRMGAPPSVSALRTARLLGTGLASLSFALVLAAWRQWISDVAGFFGAGSLLLIASLCVVWIWLSGSKKEGLTGTGVRAVSRLGFRNATFRPGRSLLCVALIAFATFIIVAVDAFRREGADPVLDEKSGNGGFPLLAESLLPVLWDPNSPEGREALALDDGEDSPVTAARLVPFRVRPGEDASCLNLYRPQNPRVLAPTADFLEKGGFSFQDSLAETEEERENPWLLLMRETEDGAVPVIGDANSMTYVLHVKLGEEILLSTTGSAPLRLRLVGMLSDSIFQGELLMSEESFLRHFPEHQGYRFFLVDVAPDQAEAVSGLLEQRLADYGFDVVSTTERLAGFHRVENTYLSTFQSLGRLGLVLGTFGLAAVLLRNVLERRRELALLQAVGYDGVHFSVMVLAENALLLVTGLLAGTVCALVAIAPAFLARGGALSLGSVAGLLLAVMATGLLASLLAVSAAIRSPLLESLRAE
ncbi:MAG: ABC transporter permease, partial [Acidobacteriota bacterium]